MSTFNFGEQNEYEGIKPASPGYTTIEGPVYLPTAKPRYVPPIRIPSPYRDLPFLNEAGLTRLTNGTLISPNYKHRVSGWGIDAEGNAEFNNGIFRGTFEIGGTLITINDITILQDTIDDLSALGGGTVALVPDTYDGSGQTFTIPSNVILNGNGSTIDFGNTAGQILIEGTNAYSTGTISINNDDTTLVGSGTTWTAGMAGQSILLGEQWYVIDSVTNTTHLELASSYIGVDLSGDTYVIATTVDNLQVLNLTLENSSIALFKCRYVNTITIDGVIAYNGLIGFDIDDTAYYGFFNSLADTCGTGITLNNVVFGTFWNWNTFSSTSGGGLIADRVLDTGFEIFAFANDTGDSISISNSKNCGFEDFSIQEASGNAITVNACTAVTFSDGQLNANGADGINITGSTQCQFTEVGMDGNAGQGIEFVSGNSDCTVGSLAITNSGSDGIKLTASTDRISIIGVSLTNNGGYGVNIAASTCDNNQVIAPAFDSNTSGNINDQGTNTIILPTDPFITASQDLTAGVPVGISNLSGGIAKAKLTSVANAHGITTPLFDGHRIQNFAPIGGDKFVYLNYTAATSDTLFAQVGSIDRAAMSVTFGTAQTVATAFTPSGGSLLNACVCKLDTDKFIVFYMLDSSGTVVKYRVGTVSGTTITFGIEATASTAATITPHNFTADFLSTDKGVFCYKNSTVTSAKIIVFTVSGTVATFGTEVTPGTNSRTDAISLVKKIGTDKFALVTHIASANLYAQVYTCSGTTITSGTEAQISTTSGTPTDGGFEVVSPATDVFVTGFGSTDNLVACTVSGTTISAGTTITTTQTQGGIYARSASEIYCASRTSGVMRSVALSGNTLTLTGTIGQIYTTISPFFILPIDNGYMYEPTTTDGVTNITSWIEGMSNNWVGLVRSTVARGSSSAVNVTGSVNASQSGLTPGAWYKVVNGVLSFVSSSVSVNTLDDIDVGIAMSATQIII